jgi:uncharacterized protein YprB with RNaseH-like and TPR domain
MVARKKPEGELWAEFVRKWHEIDHVGKLSLCKMFGVTYDGAKHWISDAGEATKKVEKEDQPKMVMVIEELLGSKPAVNLDFVCFDIETSNLDADFSILLSAAIKPYGCSPIVFRADSYPEWTTKRNDDHRIVADIANELRRHAIVVGHYSQKFDIPFLRAKMAKHGIEPLPQMFGIDTWRIAKNNFKVTRRSLQNLVYFFDIGEKGGVEGNLWMDAAYAGSTEAMDEIVKHNIVDTEILEKLACISFPYLRSIPRL